MFLFDGPIFVLLEWTVFIAVVIRLMCTLTVGFNKSNVSLIGKTALITGGNSGMGYQTALILASRGAKVIIADKNDCTESKNKIIQTTNNQNIISKFVDLASIDSVRKFAKEINEEVDRLDILINNAGIAAAHDRQTEDGLQIHMQVNHFGPFLLTHLLIDLLKKSKPSRIIFVASGAVYTHNLSIDGLNKLNDLKIQPVKHYIQYSNTKLCNLITSNGFAEKLQGTGVTCNALHPGIVLTPIVHTSFDDVNYQKYRKELIFQLGKICGKTLYEGAQTHAYLAMADEVKNVSGKFFADCRVTFQPPITKNKQFCEAIWKKSEELGFPSMTADHPSTSAPSGDSDYEP